MTGGGFGGPVGEHQAVVGGRPAAPGPEGLPQRTRGASLAPALAQPAAGGSGWSPAGRDVLEAVLAGLRAEQLGDQPGDRPVERPGDWDWPAVLMGDLERVAGTAAGTRAAVRAAWASTASTGES